MSINNDDWVIVGKGGKPRGSKINKRKDSNNNDTCDANGNCHTTNTNGNHYNGQDWNNIQFNKSHKITAQVDKFSKTTTPNSKNNFDSRKARKIEELHEDGDFSLEKSSKKLQSSIIQGRNSLGLNQEDFAKLCNIQVNVLKSYERGTLVPTNEHINIMSKKLGVTLSK